MKMSNYCPILKILIHETKRVLTIDLIQLNTDIIYEHVMVVVLTSEVFSTSY